MGRLVSINRKNSYSIEETPLYYEPKGVALSYLCAGAPCLIENLWDVTDNDIDRYVLNILPKSKILAYQFRDPRGPEIQLTLSPSFHIF